MASIVIGTAGHVDHGKTALVRALTGGAGAGPSGDEAALAAGRGALDRLKDEQQRGITIDLGFAHTRIGATEVAFVDVPGHERFVRNMLAGAGGFDAVLLVVAADESVKPQTREHLAICRLLGLERGLIALTKVDLADEETHALAALEVRELVAGTFLAEAPIVPVSARTGVGLDTLRRALAALATDPTRRSAREAVRLPIDRAFSAKGFGTIVTGTLVTGAVAEGDELELLPEARHVRVRGVHVHHQAVPRADAPQRVAVNLGQIGLEDVGRGVTLASPGTLAVTTRLDVRVDLLADSRALSHGRRVRLHLGTSEVGARVALCATRPREGSSTAWRPAAVGEVAVAMSPGGAAMARLRLDHPVGATRGDRFVLRAGSPVTTIGGGVVLDPEPSTRGLRRAAALPRFLALDEAGAAAPLVFLRDAGGRGLTAGDLVRRAGLGTSTAATALATWVAGGQAVEAGGRWYDRAAVAAAEGRLVAELTAAHRRAPGEAGVARETVRERVTGLLPPAWFDLVVARLVGRGVLVGLERLSLASHQVQVAPDEARAREAVGRALKAAALAPPDRATLASATALSSAVVDRVLLALVRERQVVRLGDLHFHADALTALKEAIGRESAGARAGGRTVELDVAEFKRRHGLSRKFAIPLLEWLDRERVTRRVGETRVVL